MSEETTGGGVIKVYGNISREAVPSECGANSIQERARLAANNESNKHCLIAQPKLTRDECDGTSYMNIDKMRRNVNDGEMCSKTMADERELRYSVSLRVGSILVHNPGSIEIEAREHTELTCCPRGDAHRLNLLRKSWKSMWPRGSGRQVSEDTANAEVDDAIRE